MHEAMTIVILHAFQQFFEAPEPNQDPHGPRVFSSSSLTLAFFSSLTSLPWRFLQPVRPYVDVYRSINRLLQSENR